MKNKKFYCVGNAHLDPVWLWRWQEGSCEAKATIRSALDRMKEYPEFIFVCSSASVFEWIEEFDPDMFEEIRQRVKEGRFVIVGGMYVQPDCNLPSGESFARQSLYAQRYFQEKFGVTAHTGYNVDSFGHNAMLPQILKKSGMDHYIFMRPGNHEKELPGQLFHWVSPDGSQVLTARISDPYCKVVENTERMEFFLEKTLQHDPVNEELFFFYGVGNHGGGPTKKCIEMILEARKNHPDAEFIFSDTHDFFDCIRAKEEQLPVVQDDLQYHAIGCYAAVSDVKDAVRRAECSLTAAESFGMLANVCCGKAYPDTKILEAAWKNVLFAHFHDSMGGCSIKEVHDDTLLMLGESRSVAARMENNALQTLSWQIDTSDANKGIPIILFNPHCFVVDTVVRCNLRKKAEIGIFDEQGNGIPCQRVHAASHLTFDQSEIVFEVSLPPVGYKTYYVRILEQMQPSETVEIQKLPRHLEVGEEKDADKESVTAAGNVLESLRYRLQFESHTGYLVSFFDKEQERELLRGYGAVPVVIDEQGYDTWAHGKTHFDREAAKFTDAILTVVENGPVQATIKIESYYNRSKLTQYFTLTANGVPQVRAVVDWQEKHKLLKLRFETALNNPKAYYEIPFGVKERDTDGREYPGLMWQALRVENGGLAILNDNKYSFSAQGSAMDLTIVRSPYYNDHNGCQEDPEGIFTDQGSHQFRYSLLPLHEDGWGNVIKEARLLNTPPTLIIENNHEGTLPAEKSVLHLAEENIVLSAFKRAEDGQGIVLRAYETDGKTTVAHITGDALPVPLTAKFGPYAVNTYYLADGATEWKEVLLTEL